MSVGRVLTLGLGTPFSEVKYLVTLGLGTGATPPIPPTPTTDSTPFASNWQAHYWVHSKRRTKREEEDERIRLGILPAREQEQAEQALDAGLEAAVAVAKARDGEEKTQALARQREALEDFKEAFRNAYADAYIAQAVEDVWREQIRKTLRRRKAALLLLH